MDKRKDRIDETIKREHKLWVWVYQPILLVLGIVLVFSLLLRNVFSPDGLSISLWLAQNNCFCLAVYTFLCSAVSSAALAEVSKAVGVSSILIGWLYSVLQKEECGFYYSELLEQLYPHHNRLVLIHVFAIIFAIWQAYSGSREGAMLSLLIIFVVCFPLWNALRCLVFFPGYRRYLIRLRWIEEIEQIFKPRENEIPQPGLKKSATAERLVEGGKSEKTIDHENRTRETMEKIYRLINTVTLESINHRDMICCLARALCYLSRFDLDKCKKEDYRLLLIHLSTCWEHLLRGRSQRDRNYLVREVFYGVQKEQKKKPFCEDSVDMRQTTKLALGQSYVLWLLQDKEEMKSSDADSSVQDLLPELNNDLSVSIHSYLYDQESDFVSYIITGYWVLDGFLLFIPKSDATDSGKAEQVMMPLNRAVADKEHLSWNSFAELCFPWNQKLAEKTETVLQQINAKVLPTQQESESVRLEND